LKLNNRAENNIIVDLIEGEHKGKTAAVSFFKLREGPLTGGAIRRNMLYNTRDRGAFYDQGPNPRLPDAWAKESDADFNIFFSPENPKLATRALERGQGDGIDIHSLATDPLFVDPANGDFRVKPNSPALKLGFVPFDISNAGLIQGPFSQKK
jgi:hypothetical protein